MTPIASGLISVLVVAAAAQQAIQPTAEKPLVTVTAVPDHLMIRAGEDLGVTVKLTAGPKGAYIPNHFGDFIENCQSGFSAEIVTSGGDRASDSTRGCGASILFGGPLDADLARDYVLLKPGETRIWHTTLTKITRKPGTYEIHAEYLSAQTRIKEVAALPQVRGLMVIGHMEATPVTVRIR